MAERIPRWVGSAVGYEILNEEGDGSAKVRLYFREDDVPDWYRDKLQEVAEPQSGCREFFYDAILSQAIVDALV